MATILAPVRVAAPAGGAGPAGRRAKWEVFWAGLQPAAEATHRRSAELVLEQLAPERTSSQPLQVLDLGCGNGRVLELLEASGDRVVGVDLAAGAFSAIRSQRGSAPLLVQADGFDLGLADSSFDAVVSLGYACVGSYPGVQGEIARVLRPNGLALVDFRHLGLYHAPLFFVRGRRLLGAWRRGESALALLGLRPAAHWTAAGFQLERLTPFNSFPPLGNRLSPSACLAIEHRIGAVLAPLLARTALATFRRLAAAEAGPRRSRHASGPG